jgi:O-acetylhomoserine/O-acetylserine sulfhydrylase-like pyridoxal-dependent enzyme
MFTALTMNPGISTVQRRLATLTAGVGGSLRSIGSAAGYAAGVQGHRRINDAQRRVYGPS